MRHLLEKAENIKLIAERLSVNICDHRCIKVS
jgi:hypothetical protein